MIPILDNINELSSKTAVIEKNNNYSYSQLSIDINAYSNYFYNYNQTYIATLLKGSYNYTKTLLGIWKSDNIAVPLSSSYPIIDLDYFIKDSNAQFLIFDDENSAIAKELKSLNQHITFLHVDEIKPTKTFHPKKIDINNEALVIYTSGTTNKPKGVVHSHAALDFQFKTLSQAWHWSKEDVIPVFLPLHHIHGIVNKLCCSIFNNATIDIYDGFKIESIYNNISKGTYTIFMAVPTIYKKLITYHQKQDQLNKQSFETACKQIRLMISGSAALPVSILKEWEEISGHRLLERYGMSEIGMAISNPYHGERKPGHIGQAFNGIEVKLMNDDGHEIKTDNNPGEIYIKGPNLFKTYLNKAEAYHSSFKDGWFMTGDIAALNNGYYKIVGRKSVDIIKSGGYKISALEIEEVARQYKDVSDCAVVGIEDEEWGEIIGIWVESMIEDEDDFKSYLKQNLPNHKLPRIYQLEGKNIPRNSIGKVLKKEVIKSIIKP